MERLTARDDKTNRPYYPYCFRDDTCDGKGASEKCDNCNFNKKTINKLAEYEDAEEQGLLLRLPCKVGTPVYMVAQDCGGDTLDCRCGDCEGCSYLYSFVETNSFDTYMLDEIGKTVFLTKEEAEQALAEMKNIEETKDKLAEEVESIGYLSKEEAKRMIEQALTGKKEV